MDLLIKTIGGRDCDENDDYLILCNLNISYQSKVRKLLEDTSVIVDLYIDNNLFQHQRFRCYVIQYEYIQSFINSFIDSLMAKELYPNQFFDMILIFEILLVKWVLIVSGWLYCAKEIQNVYT